MRSSLFSGLILLCVVLPFQAEGRGGSQRLYDSPENAALYPIAAEMARLKNWIFGSFWEISDSIWSSDARQFFLDSMEEEESEGKEDGCLACTGFIILVQSLIEDGASYEEIKNITMDICYRIVPPAGFDPDKLCDAILDTYAPHVLYVLNVTDRSPVEICTLYNSCGPNDNVTEYSYISEQIERPTIARQASSAAKRESSKAETITLLHLADIHFDALYSEGTPSECDMPLCCRSEYSGNGSARYWGDYECNIPIRTLDLFLDFIQQNFAPEIIAYSGDTIQHTVWDQPQNETLAIQRHLADSFSQFFPDAPSYFSIGNHDTSPTNLYYSKRPQIQELNQAYFDMWQPVSRFTDEQRLTYLKGGYYTISVVPGLRILSYNSNYFPLDNFYSILNYDETDYPEMQQFMEDTLSAARENSEKVIVLGHHPSGGSGMFTEYSHFITDIHARYGDIIVLHLLGHSHSDWFALVKDFETGETRGVQLSGPSLTSYTDMNPSFRLIYLDSTTFEPVDMLTYRLDIAVDGNNLTPAIQFTYSHVEEYNMTDLTPSGFDDFTNRMELDRDLLNLYRYNKETRVDPLGSCDDDCAKGELCDIRYTDYERQEQCNELPLRTKFTSDDQTV